MATILDEISQQMQNGKAKAVKQLVQQSIDEGITPNVILEKGLISGMTIIGEKFKKNEVFVPEVLIAARAMNNGLDVLKPYLATDGVKAKGKVIIGTVKGDLHDIGKNLVKMMMEGRGLEVLDLGVDVPPEKFVTSARENQADIICCSSLLTTTMHAMKDVVDEAIAQGIRGQIIIMVGGAPVTQAFCDSIGADCYTPDAASAADAALAYCEKK